MTAHPDYALLETMGLWADAPEAQRREVVVSFGAATLVLSDLHDRPLAHWSLAALVRLRRSGDLVIYSPTSEGEETLEITDPTMNAAISALQAKSRKGRGSPGLVRRIIGAGVILAFFAVLAVFPHALSSYAASITPEATARGIGQRVLEFRPDQCTGAARVLDQLADQFGDDEVSKIVVVRLDAGLSARMPGGIVLIDAKLVERQNGPEALVGHVLYQRQLDAERPILYDLFRVAGFFQTIGFLTGKPLEAEILKNFATRVQDPSPPDVEELEALFRLHDLSPLPFLRTHPPLQAALASVDIDATGPVLSDNQWAVLEGVCL